MEKLDIQWLKHPKQAQVSIGDICSCLCTFYNNGKANIMVIDSVWTDEEHRNRGYGTSLMHAAIDFAKEQKADCVELVVNRDNSLAKNVYERVGMTLTNKDLYRLILNRWKT